MNIREQFDAMVDVLVDVQREMHALEALERAGQESPALQRVAMVAWPAIKGKWASLRDAQRTGRLPAPEVSALIARLHLDLAMLREVLAGRIVVSELEDN